MIDATIKRSLGQMMKGVQVVGANHDGVTRAYCSHWVCQVSFEEPIVMASVSPKHDTHPLIAASGEFTVSILAATMRSSLTSSRSTAARRSAFRRVYSSAGPSCVS